MPVAIVSLLPAEVVGVVRELERASGFELVAKALLDFGLEVVETHIIDLCFVQWRTM